MAVEIDVQAQTRATLRRAGIGTTPWGVADTCEELAPGIYSVTTPSHGGLFLDAERNAQVPASWRAASFRGMAHAGWYEEDCDWALVALTFPYEPRFVGHLLQARAVYASVHVRKGCAPLVVRERV